MKNLDSRGDTIVEVLISIAVVSLVLGGAYVSANRSLNAARQAEERGQALKLVEGQVERLKSLSSDPASAVYTHSSPFCIDNGNNVTTPPNCDASPGITYKISIQRSGNTFTTGSNWDRAGGGGTEQLNVINKLYP